MTKQKICIVGAGLTGLTAAYKLSKGYEVIVLEEGDDIGGLAGGFKMEGEELEKVYHHIFKTDKDVIKLAEELGLGNKLEWLKSSVAVYYKGGLYPYSSLKDFLTFKPLSLFSRFRLGCSLFVLKIDKGWEKYTKITAKDWLLKYAGKEAYKVIWEPLLVGKFHNLADKVSMAWLWARLHIRLNTRSEKESGEVLGYFKDGFIQISEKLARSVIDNGGEVRINSKVQKIKKLDNGKIIVKSNNKEMIFDKVLVTTPSGVFANILETDDNVYLESLRSIKYLGSVCMAFSTPQNLSNYYWHNINDLELPFLAFLQHTNLVPKENYNNQNIYYLGSYLNTDSEEFNLTDEQIEQSWFAGLKTVFPDFDKSQIREQKIFRFKNAQHVVDNGYQKRIPSYKTPVGGVYLANFSQIFPEDRGTNYAVKEGLKIAKIILE